ncbi:MAG TPA: hypothetical protein VHJ34_03795 [Actinomycetota bacterium]|nr:hypothetical protein [Actinomycetota bacterium]
MTLAHGVGRVYDLPVPLSLYVAASAATVLLSFVVRSASPLERGARGERRVAGPRVAGAVRGVLRVAGVLGLVVALVAGAYARSEGFTATSLLFWVAGLVGVVALSALVAGVWDALDPWATLDLVYRSGDRPPPARTPPWWIAPAALYALFWFELVSGAGYRDTALVAVLLAYSAVALGWRPSLGPAWRRLDPLSLLFGFAGRSAPLRLAGDGIYARSPVAAADDPAPMPRGAFAALFVALGATTLDNVRETVGWTDLLDATNLDEVARMPRDTVALALFAAAFFGAYLAAVAVAHRWIGRRLTTLDVARRIGWSLAPIAVAYLLAHNVPLLATGVPALLRALSDPLALGWNVLGTAHLFEGFEPSPKLVWWIEIVLVVGGHVLGVLVAHRAAWRLSTSYHRAVRSQYALTALMVGYTAATLWLLAQPLVT